MSVWQRGKNAVVSAPPNTREKSGLKYDQRLFQVQPIQIISAQKRQARASRSTNNIQGSTASSLTCIKLQFEAIDHECEQMLPVFKYHVA